MYDFLLLYNTDFGSYQWHMNPDTPSYMLNWLELDEFWATVSPGIIFKYVYSWQTIKCRHRGRAYSIGDNLYRTKVTPSQIDYWGHPVGWFNGDLTMYNYPSMFEDYFQYSGHPAPPL
jgi:hypothetical protein